MEELLNQRDLDAYLEFMDPAIEWHVAREDPDTDVHRGRDAVRAYVEGWIDEPVRRPGPDRDPHAGQGASSGTPLDERVSFVWTLSGGRVTKVEDLGRSQASTK